MLKRASSTVSVSVQLRPRAVAATVVVLAVAVLAGVAAGVASAGADAGSPSVPTFAEDTHLLPRPHADHLAAGTAAGTRAALTPAGVAQQPGSPNAATQVLLPILSALDDRRCSTWVAVQNIGPEPTKAVLLVWGKPSDSGCNGPLKAECTGLISPGGAWNLLGNQIPTGSRSGILFSYNTRRLSEIGVTVGYDDVVADYMCERLFYGVVGDCDDYVAFKAAYESGGEFVGVPMDRAVGSPLAVQAKRACPGSMTPGVQSEAAYNGVGWNRRGAVDAAFGGYRYHVAPVFPTGAPQTTLLYAQNGGAEDAVVEMWFQAQGTCDGGRLCRTTTIRPGETVTLDTEGCATAVGGVRFKSSTPLAVVADTTQSDGLTSYTAVPPTISHDAAGGSVLAGAGQALHGALLFDRDRGWEHTVTVQNLSLDEEARVRVTFLGPDGREQESAEAPVCAGGTADFVLPIRDERPGMRAGSMRVDSLPSGGSGTAPGAPVSAVAVLTKYNDLHKSEVMEQIAYNLVPAGLSISGSTSGASGTDAGIGVIALPALNKDLDATGVTNEVALANLVQTPGWTDVAVLVYDQNDLVDVLCRRLDAGETTYINLQVNGAMAPGFLGSALVSATQWEHLAASGPGPQRNLVGLAAALSWRSGSVIGEDIPGDEAAMASGIPLRSLPLPLLEYSSAACSFDAAPKPGPTPHPPGPIPDALAAQVHVPVINNQGRDDVCKSTIEIRNAGTEPAKAILITWGEPGFCSPQCAGPLNLSCSALIAPGGTWSFAGAAVPTGSASGILYGATVKTMAEIGAEPGTGEPVADFLCDTLFTELVGDCEDSRRFRLAQNAGLTFAGVPLDRAVAGPLEAVVERTCPDTTVPGMTNSSNYAGISGARFDAFDSWTGGHWQTVVPVYADYGGVTTLLYVQNGGAECTSVSLWFQPSGLCLRHRKCTIYGLAPGETYAFDATACVGPDWHGSAVLHSEEPLAIAVDALGRAAGEPVQWSYLGYPGKQAHDLNGDGRVDDGDVATVQAALGASPVDPQWNARADLTGDRIVDDNDLDWMRANLCGSTNPDPAEPPPGQPRRSDQVALPALGYAREDDDCRSWFAVQNIGDEPAKAAVVYWGKPPEGGQPCAGPSKIECTGLISPGTSWHVQGDQVASGAKSGIVFSLSAKTLRELGLDPARDDVVADVVCDALVAEVTGDCDDYRAFKTAFDLGTEFAGLPMDRVAGSALAAHVDRACPGEVTPSVDTSAAYRGLGANELGRHDPVLDRYVYYAPVIYADIAGFSSLLNIQNAGHEPATVSLHFRALDDCSASKTCGPLLLQPGDSHTFDPSARPSGQRCVGPSWQGNAWLVSNQPLAAVVDTVGRDTLTSYNATPARMDYDARGEPLGDDARTVAYGPLIYSPDDGWDTGVFVQNLHATSAAHVRATFFDSNGAPIDVVDDVICPMGGMVYFLPTIDARGGTDVGTVRVVSQRPVWGPLTEPAPISAIAMLIQYTDAARSETRQAIAYNLLSGSPASSEPVRAAALNSVSTTGMPSGGSAVVALPGLALAVDGVGLTSEIAVADFAQAPGERTAAMQAYDRTALVDATCRRLEGNTARYLDLHSFTRIQPGFRGSGLVSAVVWDREIPEQPIGAATVRPGLAAATVWLLGATRGTDVPGDEMGAALGVPMSRLPAGAERSDDPCARPQAPIYLPVLTNQ